MELADGISLENFFHKGSPSLVPPYVVWDYLHNKLNKSQIVPATIFDLLTSQVSRMRPLCMNGCLDPLWSLVAH